MQLRSTIFLLLCLSAVTRAQTSASSNQQNFQDPDFGLLLSYPAEFIPANPKLAAPSSYTSPKNKHANPPCVQAPLSVGHTTAAGNSVLIFSIIDDACPSVLNDAQQLGAFTQTQLLRQLKRYGVPTITHHTTLFTHDGRPAAFTLASAHATETQLGDTLTTTYAAKVCLFGRIPIYNDNDGGKSKHALPPSTVICLDLTTQQRDLLPQMLAFQLQFDDHEPRPIVPAALLK